MAPLLFLTCIFLLFDFPTNVFFISVGSPDVLPLPNRSVREGRALKLKCKIRGDRPSHPPPAFSWFKDGQRLQSASDLVIKSKK